MKNLFTVLAFSFFSSSIFSMTIEVKDPNTSEKSIIHVDEQVVKNLFTSKKTFFKTIDAFASIG